jgi:hypothetical protein
MADIDVVEAERGRPVPLHADGPGPRRAPRQESRAGRRWRRRRQPPRRGVGQAAEQEPRAEQSEQCAQHARTHGGQQGFDKMVVIQYLTVVQGGEASFISFFVFSRPQSKLLNFLVL